jgi:hypothetical protein
MSHQHQPNQPLSGAQPWLLKWSRLSEQIFRIDKWSLCQG